MKKRMILTIGLLIFFAGGDLVFGQDQWFLEINNNTSRYWLINIDNICVGVIGPFMTQQIKIERPTKKFQVEITGISSDRGYTQRKIFWPEDQKDSKFIWKVEP
jgi:hypothetical protein